MRIHYTAVDDNIDELKECIASGQDVNAQEEQGWTPLHFAANMGNLEITKILLDSGADVDIANRAGHTALDLAAASTADDAIDVAKLIYLCGADPRHKDSLGGDTIGYLEMLNSDSRKKELLKFFREHGVE